MAATKVVTYRNIDILVSDEGQFYCHTETERGIREKTLEALKRKIDRLLKKTFKEQDVMIDRDHWGSEEVDGFEVAGRATSQRSDGQLVIRLRGGGNSHRHPNTCYTITPENKKIMDKIVAVRKEVKALEKQEETLRKSLKTMADVIGKAEDGEEG